MTLPVTFRPATDADRPFVLHHWRREYRDSPFAMTLTGDDYFAVQRDKMQKVLNDPSTKVHVAYLNEYFPEDPEHAVGFIVHSKNESNLTVVHFVFVLEAYRKHAIAQRMMNYVKPTVPVVCIDVTHKFFKLRQKHDLPYVTARELDDFHNQNPREPMKAFSKWFRDLVFKNKKARERFARNTLRKDQCKPQ